MKSKYYLFYKHIISSFILITYYIYAKYNKLSIELSQLYICE